MSSSTLSPMHHEIAESLCTPRILPADVEILADEPAFHHELCLENEKEFEGRKPIANGSAKLLDDICDSTTLEYKDKNEDSVRFQQQRNKRHMRSCVKLYINDKLKHVIGAVDYSASQGTLWTRPRVQHGGGRFWVGGTIPDGQIEQVVKQLWSFAKQAQDVEWYGDIPVIEDVGWYAAPALVSRASNEIKLHVYDLNKVASLFNDVILRKVQLGMFHVGVEVFGTEYSFEHFSNCESGISKCQPKTSRNVNYIYKESVHLGRTTLSKHELEAFVGTLSKMWTSNDYHFTHRNCLTFADAFSKAIGAHIDIPLWIRNACEVSRNSVALDFIADTYWGLAKWWTSNHSKTPEHHGCVSTSLTKHSESENKSDSSASVIEL